MASPFADQSTLTQILVAERDFNDNHLNEQVINYTDFTDYIVLFVFLTDFTDYIVLFVFLTDFTDYIVLFVFLN
ncbi:unnamed protein product [Effrenium voratum]|uniref:Uncharacterized protein n=1 Tax=Effrenium voratum TaxID=2562239 RepID=A0AA36ISE6_9DINO|nr:unnamed protein product [Effrenium voratum]